MPWLPRGTGWDAVAVAANADESVAESDVKAKGEEKHAEDNDLGVDDMMAMAMQLVMLMMAMPMAIMAIVMMI